MFNTLVYTAEGHPTAVRLYNLRKRTGSTRWAFRNAPLHVPGQTELCREVVVVSLDCPIAQEYLDKGFVHDTRKNRKKPHPAEFTIRVLRQPRDKELVIDLDAPPKVEPVSAYLAKNKPMAKAGKQRQKAAKKNVKLL